jgi:hypothetical protein
LEQIIALQRLPRNVSMAILSPDYFIYRIKRKTNITGFTYESAITDGIEVDGAETIIQSITVTPIDLILGDINITLTSAEVAFVRSIRPNYPNMKWFFRETIAGLPRTLLAGKFDVRLL